MSDLLNYTFLNVPLSQIGLAVLCIIGGFVLRLILGGVLRWVLRHTKKTDTEWDDIIIGAMAGREVLWYIAASLVMLGGAGRAFGLDHWVMPWLQRQWNRTRFARRTYLYVDEPTDRK